MKRLTFLLLMIVFFVFFTGYPMFAQSRATQSVINTIQGSWERQTNSGLQVIYFSAGGIFVIYKNGNFVIDGSYTISERVRNQPQRIVLNFGIFDLMDNVYSFNITTNELNILERHNGPRGDGSHILLSIGTYKRSSFVNSDANNLVVGTWKGTSEIFRFYRNAEGTYFTYKNEPEYIEEWSYRLKYQFLARTRNGEISFQGFDDNWKYGEFLLVPFTINGNVLRVEYEDGIREYIRQ